MKQSIKRALCLLSQPGSHITSSEKAEFKAGDLWFNIESARSDFRNLDEFAKAVGIAWENLQAEYPYRELDTLE